MERERAWRRLGLSVVVAKYGLGCLGRLVQVVVGDLQQVCASESGQGEHLGLDMLYACAQLEAAECKLNCMLHSRTGRDEY